jgi:hypothetical protein
MSEFEKDSDNLSRFFQKAAQEPRIKFEEGDWKKLEALLDAGQPGTISRSPFQWKTLVSIVAILVLSISTYVVISNDSEDASYDSGDEKSIRMVTDSIQRVVQDVQPAINSHGDNTNKLSNGSRVSIITEKQAGPLVKADQIPLFSKAQSLPSTMDTAPLDTTTGDIVLGNSLAKVIADPSLPTDSSEILTKQVTAPMATKPVKLVLADSIREKDEPAYPSRWSILLTLSPDFSSTGLRRFTSPGEAFGMLVYYRLNNALSISAGAIKSKKIYQDYGSNYKPTSEGFWAKNTNGVTPGEILGSCSVLEIPLGIQYNIRRMKRSEVYVAAGLSSYVMLKESYRYMFSTPNPGATEGWNANKTTYYPFSIVNFSVGYERSISKQIAIGISPYIKVPITSIGAWANVKLYSVGAAFTVRYNLHPGVRMD